MSIYDNLIGKKFNRLTILKILPKEKGSNRYKCECVCECGNKNIIRLDSVRYNKTLSCGCLHKEAMIDEFSPFRDFLCKAKNRIKRQYGRRQLIFNLTLEDLKEVWNKQNGICPYTGIKMFIYPASRSYRDKIPIQASLDRIDSSKGYVKDNIEFVCLGINYMKNGFKREEILDFLSKFKK